MEGSGQTGDGYGKNSQGNDDFEQNKAVGVTAVGLATR